MVVVFGVVEGGGGAGWDSGPEVMAVMSRPAVKALGPAPERMMARMEGEEDRWEKRRGRWSHILGSVSYVDWICSG